MDKDFKSFQEVVLSKIERALSESMFVFSEGFLPQFKEAVCHLLFAPSKRIRPLLVCSSFVMFDTLDHLEDILPLAVAIECLHTYSLIHDDLPAMDNSDFRRSRPSCHKAFGEDMAILAGDFLQTFAMQYFLEGLSKRYDAALVVKGLSYLTQMSGLHGLIGGQVMDIQQSSQTLSEVESMHSLKTGALLSASVLIPSILYDASLDQQSLLKQFSYHFGILFQIVDDILDTVGHRDLGKPLHQDLYKKTYVTILGLEGAYDRALFHFNLAKDSLKAIQNPFLKGLLEVVYQRIQPNVSLFEE